MTIAENYNRIVARIIDNVDNKTTDQAEGTLSVPSKAYTDPDLWQQEMDLIFKKVPVFVALTQELPNAGDYKTFQFLDKPLLITRLKDGTARVMLNVCSHRAMTVATEPCGNKSRFTCPTTAGCIVMMACSAALLIKRNLVILISKPMV